MAGFAVGWKLADSKGTGAASVRRRTARCALEEGEKDFNLGDWRNFRSALIAREGGQVGTTQRGWAHEVHHMEPGMCLVSNASHEWSEHLKHRNKAVILITKTSETECTGVMLNRAVGQTVHNMSSLEARIGREFGGNPVYLGGDCSLGTIEMLHPCNPKLCAGAEQIVPGLYQGGFNASRELVQDSVVDPASFRFYLGYTSWKMDELQAELKRNVWHRVACSTDLLLKTGAKDLWHEVLSLVGLPTAAT